MITVYINDQELQVEEGTTVIAACDRIDAYVPRLCYHPDIPVAAKCGICLVKLNDDEDGTLACATDVEDGMRINTLDQTVKAEAYERFLDLTMNFNLQNNIELNLLVRHFQEKGEFLFSKEKETNSIVFNKVQCVDCYRCYRVCNYVQQTQAIKGGDWTIYPDRCISCGQCTAVCPAKALTEEYHSPLFFRALASGKIMCLQVAPSARVSVGELFGDPPGTVCTGKIISAARQIGFKYVFDTNFGADMTIIEEGTELVGRLTKNEKLPMFTSCCPAWVKYVQQRHPHLISHLSTAKSPHFMLGSMAKSYFAQRHYIKPKDLFVISLMPCVAKKEEIKKNSDVDAVFTVREFGHIFRQFGLDWNSLPEGKFDSLLGESTAASTIFGVSGGVMEAALRYAHEQMTSQPLGEMSYEVVRGFDSIRTAEVSIGSAEIKVAICNGIGPAKEFIDSGEYKKYTFIEVMSCIGGCIGGGGQPKGLGVLALKSRAKAIFDISNGIKKPSSRDNTEAQIIYKSFIGEPGGEKAHQFLHIHWN